MDQGNFSNQTDGMSNTPADVPTPRPAATLMLIDNRPTLQVYMMKRSSSTVFGGMWVFPGGTVDEDDCGSGYEAHSPSLTDRQASTRLSIDSGGLAYYVAAVREAFEEAGILLAVTVDTGTTLPIATSEDKARYHDYRHAVHGGEMLLSQLVESENLSLDTRGIHYVGRWITPPSAPKRFDTRFFLARMPTSQDPIHDDNELVNSAWFEPASLLQRADKQEVAVMAPTRRMLESLLPFRYVEDAMNAASVKRDAKRVPFADPDDGLVPPSLQNVEPGWVYLRPDG